MRIQKIDGQDYKLPNNLNNFQLEMYVHLINWKWENITKDPGHDRGIEYDAILPERYAENLRVLHRDLVSRMMEHHDRFPFRIHKYFNHMASSQAANINLFLPILLNPGANEIIRKLNPDFARLATDKLDHGWRIEYWDEPTGALNDKSAMAGTDADLAIAYYNHNDEPCLWLIEHKLTEKEFTKCGGYKSKGRTDKIRHDCTRNFREIMESKDSCYYHDICGYRYWDISEIHRDFFVNHAKHEECPFQGGMNQLWRNQLLTFAVEQQGTFMHAHFSVVRHPRNTALDASIKDYIDLIGNNSKFSIFTSRDVIQAAETLRNNSLKEWADWYRTLYKL
ncbi:hypothetical protein B4O97_00875 [Marispirochaeta aestuarii]|uniref:Uncharacterized protein n=1 Tax=Marispirochaeta aestuarii TaxID=1963862 RepID=A0A1Y1S2Y4_9SPIO|nr:hypothetical protein [Marispirochaeta aestuarii]ORC38342.1 hypothetical protein B4O97_00875 [Marispirochaeta aestuarii]